jgi:predicted phage terminase large subunit-like protein
MRDSPPLPDLYSIQSLDWMLRVDFKAFVEKVFAELLPGDRFCDNWHIDAVCHAIMETINGTGQRLVVTLPPRSLKSLIISVGLPAFLLGRDPTRRVVSISYSDDLSTKMSADFRKVVNSPWYRRVFPGTIIVKNTDRETTTSRNGGRFATSVGGTLTGRGGNLFIIDDPLKPADAFSKAKRETVNEWLKSTLASRPDDKRVDKMILLMQRVHADDPAGTLLASGKWRHLNLPAIASVDEVVPLSFGRSYRRCAGSALDEQREPLEVLETTRAQMGERAFSAQYLQQPIPEEGGMFKRSWFRAAAHYPFDEPGAFILQSWDTAMTSNDSSDWSACTTWLVHDGNYYLMEVLRGRYRFPELKKMVRRQIEAYDPAHVLVEYKGSGISLVQELEADGIKIEPYRSNLEKDVRAGRASVAVEAGRVFLPQKMDPGTQAFLDEVLSFPGGRHDDQVDSMSQAINWWENRLQAPSAMFGTY